MQASSGVTHAPRACRSTGKLAPCDRTNHHGRYRIVRNHLLLTPYDQGSGRMAKGLGIPQSKPVGNSSGAHGAIICNERIYTGSHWTLRGRGSGSRASTCLVHFRFLQIVDMRATILFSLGSLIISTVGATITGQRQCSRVSWACCICGKVHHPTSCMLGDVCDRIAR